MGTLFLTKEARIFNAENIISSVCGYGRTGQLGVKNEIRMFPNTIHKDKLKMDEQPKCRTINYITLRGKHRQNTI